MWPLFFWLVAFGTLTKKSTAVKPGVSVRAPAFCVKCRYYLAPPSGTDASTESKCAFYPVFEDYDTHVTYLIHGRYPEKGYDFLRCSQVRRDPKLCGKEGRNFRASR